MSSALVANLGGPELLLMLVFLVPLLVLVLIVFGIVLAVRGRRRQTSELEHLRNEVEQLRNRAP